MSEAAVKWIVWIVGALVISSGGVAVLWALFWDRARGGLRCSKCWYDMGGVPAPGLQCPECGTTHARAGALARTRRRWKWAAAGLAISLIGYAGILTRKAVVDGWPSAIPSTILVTLWPVSEAEWLDQNSIAIAPGHAADLELGKRFLEGKLADWQLHWWVGRLERYAKKHRRFGIERERVTHQKLADTNVKLNGVYANWNAILDEVEHATGITITRVNMPPDANVSPLTFANETFSALDLLDSTEKWYAQNRNGGIQWDLDGNTVVIGHLLNGDELRTVACFDCRALVDLLSRKQNSLSQDSSSPEIMTGVLEISSSSWWTWSTLPAVPNSQEFARAGEFLIAQDSPRSLLMLDQILMALRSCPSDDAVSIGIDWNPVRAHMRTLTSSRVTIPESTVAAGDVPSLVRTTGVAVRLEPSMGGMLLPYPWFSRLRGKENTTADALSAAFPGHAGSGLPAPSWTLDAEGVRIVAGDLDRIIRVYDVGDILTRWSSPDLSMADRISNLKRTLRHLPLAEGLPDYSVLPSVENVGCYFVVPASVRGHFKVEELLQQLRNR